MNGKRTGINGLGLSETISNVPVLPLIMPGSGYGEQFFLALEKATLLARWFESRVILSRSPVPPLNLANQKIGRSTRRVDDRDQTAQPELVVAQNQPDL